MRRAKDRRPEAFGLIAEASCATAGAAASRVVCRCPADPATRGEGLPRRAQQKRTYHARKQKLPAGTRERKRDPRPPLQRRSPPCARHDSPGPQSPNSPGAFDDQDGPGRPSVQDDSADSSRGTTRAGEQGPLGTDESVEGGLAHHSDQHSAPSSGQGHAPLGLLWGRTGHSSQRAHGAPNWAGAADGPERFENQQSQHDHTTSDGSRALVRSPSPAHRITPPRCVLASGAPGVWGKGCSLATVTAHACVQRPLPIICDRPDRAVDTVVLNGLLGNDERDAHLKPTCANTSGRG